MSFFSLMVGMALLVALSGCTESMDKQSKEPNTSGPKTEQVVKQENETQIPKQAQRSDTDQLKKGFDGTPFGTQKEYIEQKVNWKPGVKERIQKFVRDHHKFYEDTLTYGRIDNVNWEQQKKHADTLIREAKEILPEIKEQVKTMEENKLLTDLSIDDDPRELKLDFESLVAVLEIATSKKDKTGLVYAHRILHDLDVELNGTKTHKFGMSSYDHGGENRPKLWDYIEKNGRESPKIWE